MAPHQLDLPIGVVAYGFDRDVPMATAGLTLRNSQAIDALRKAQ